jgi:p-hydroxybenzoate 3-monooxygenase
MKTQVGIIGAGPGGLLLSHLLHLRGIDSVVVEAKSREYIENRIRAGVLEQGTADLLVEAGVGGRMRQEGLVHEGIELSFGGSRHRIDFRALANAAVIVYGQHEVVKDLVAARIAAGGPILFETEATALEDMESLNPRIKVRGPEGDGVIECDFIAGCDGFHGIARQAMPPSIVRSFEQSYPFGWLGILAEAAPASEELIYARHENGFALFSMRSPEVTRLYLQCAPDEDIGKWPDARIWDELHTRLEAGGGPPINEGAILQKSVTPVRSFVAEPMQHGRLFLAGDAAHIVPPTGAKGMNLAVSDVRVLVRALNQFYRSGESEMLQAYSATCLRRVWKVQRFSWWMTKLLHRFPDTSEFDDRLQLADLDHVTSSETASRSLAENYVGLPLD